MRGDQVDSASTPSHAMNFGHRLQNVVYVLDNMNGAHFIKTAVAERQGMIHIRNYVCPCGIRIQIDANRSRSFVLTTAQI
jgi:hypothetical protein